jgi:hypothetical protein
VKVDDIIGREILAIETAEVLVERFRAALMGGRLEEADALLARLQRARVTAQTILARRRERLDALP